MNKLKLRQVKGFTLVELLIVIALISILSVAVLATINPIEQANKAKDASTQNDAAEVLNAYERYYANAQKYPWQMFKGGTPNPLLGVDDAVTLSSTQAGFGICYANTDVSTAAADATATCNTSGANIGVLSEADELKPSFASKTAFKNPGANNENKLWTIKSVNAGGSIYVCYIPKAKSNRQMTEKLVCINSVNSLIVPAVVGGSCAPLAIDGTWATPLLDGNKGMFRCVPE